MYLWFVGTPYRIPQCRKTYPEQRLSPSFQSLGFMMKLLHLLPGGAVADPDDELENYLY